MAKKFLDANGLTYFAQLLDNYPNNEILATVIDAISAELDRKANTEDIPSGGSVTITNTLNSGTLIATINGTNIYAPEGGSYPNVDEVGY